MNDYPTSHTLGSSGPDRVVTGFRRGAALQALLMGLVVAFAVGCTGGHEEGQTPVAESTRPDATPVREDQTPTAVPPQSDAAVEKGHALAATSTQPDATPVAEAQTPTAVLPQSDPPVSGDAQVPEVTFPQHDAPLGTDNGGNYHAGRLVLDEGCLRVEVPPDANGPGRASLLIWPSGFAFSVEDGAVRIVDSHGEIAASVGDHIRLTHATVSYQEAKDQGLIQGMSEDCAGPHYLVGDEVTVFDPENQRTELRLLDPDVIFPRKKTIIATGRSQKVAEGVGELVLDGNCLRLGRVDGHGYTIIWPAGFSPHVEEGVVQVRNGAGRVIAQVGDKLSMGGGYFSRDEDWDCPGGLFVAHSIEIVPDPSPILQQAGYGGTLRDPDDRSILYVRLVNPSQEAAEEAAHRYVSPYLLKEIREIRPLKAPYSVEQLEMWHESTRDEIRSIPAVRLFGYPMERNRLIIEVNRKDDVNAVRKILDILTRHEVPHGAVIILDE